MKLKDGQEVTLETYIQLINLHKLNLEKVKITRCLKTTGSIVRTWKRGITHKYNYRKLYTVGEYNLTEIFKESK